MKGGLWASLATAAWGCHRQFGNREAECEMIAITHRFRLYPSDKQKREVAFYIECLYGTVKRGLELRSMLPRLKEERSELKEVQRRFRWLF